MERRIEGGRERGMKRRRRGGNKGKGREENKGWRKKTIKKKNGKGK